MKFALAKTETPLFNTPHFEHLHILAKEIETMALKDTKFSILDQIKETIFLAKTTEYPHPVYVDGRFLEFIEQEPPERIIKKPSHALISQRLLAIHAKKLPYLWGGNWSEGIPSLPHLQGVDCSGLLYEATCGYTPRNTSELVSYKQGLPIEGLSREALTLSVKPLDLIVWKGHVIIVLDPQTTIESREHRGVILTPLKERFDELLDQDNRLPLNEPHPSHPYFVIRRWYANRESDWR